MRSNINLRLYCSVHPNQELEAVSDSNTRMGADSAYEVTARISVRTCQLCMREFENLKAAVAIFKSI